MKSSALGLVHRLRDYSACGERAKELAAGAIYERMRRGAQTFGGKNEHLRLPVRAAASRDIRVRGGERCLKAGEGREAGCSGCW